MREQRAISGTATSFNLWARMALCMTLLFSTHAVAAQRGRAQRARRGRARVVQAPQSAQIAPALGNLHWGMSPRQVFDALRGGIEGRFQPQMARASGSVEEDRLRNQMNEEIRVLRASYVRFRGQASGWDSSFLRTEYTQNNNESMMVLRDQESQTYYFFIQDRLWKMYKAFNAAVFAGQDFAQFETAIEGRFGQGAVREGALIEGGESTHWVEWQDATTRLRAVDNTHFYGFYCLVFEEKSTLGRLAQLRTNTATRGENGSELVDAIIRNDDRDASDGNADIADRITGVRVRNQQAPEGQARPGAQPTQRPAQATPQPAPTQSNSLEGSEF